MNRNHKPAIGGPLISLDKKETRDEIPLKMPSNSTNARISTDTTPQESTSGYKKEKIQKKADWKEKTPHSVTQLKLHFHPCK